MIEFRLLKLRIFNFACYYGENVLDFTAKTNKNIFLFNVLNGFGKTSLFHAIKWGFYGERIEYFKDSEQKNVKDFLNDRVDQSKDLCFVEITFRYERSLYLLKRTFKPSYKKSSTFSLVKDGRELSEETGQDELDMIMPKNFADFFMFDGELLNRFMAAQKDLPFLESIHQLLGLKQIRILKDDLIKLQDRYDNRLTQQHATSEQVRSKQKIIAGLMSEIKNCDLKIEKYDNEIQENEKTREGLDQQRLVYRNLPNVMADLSSIKSKKETCASDIAVLKAQLKDNAENFYMTIIEKDLINFIKKNEKRILELQDISGLTDIQAETQAAREKILAKSIPECDVCGHKLDAEETKKLRDEQKRIRDSLKIFAKNKKERDDLKNEVNQFKAALDIIKNYDFQKEIDDLQEKKIKYDLWDKKDKELTKESQKEKYGSLAKINREISQLEQENSTKRSQIAILKQKIDAYKEQKDEITKEIKRLGHDDQITQKTSNLSTYISELIRKLEEALDIGTEAKREKILKKANELFISITNKPDEYKGLDFENEDSYAFVIKTKDKKLVTHPSKGEKQVLAMSFLLGLNQYTGRSNVIVMDTPVASLDDFHSAGVGKALAKLNNQVIFLAQPKELTGEIYTNMKPAVAKEFVVNRQDYKSTFEEVKR